MDPIELHASHPVPLRWRPRAGVRETVGVARAVTPIRIARLPADAMVPRAVAFMDNARSGPSSFEHEGTLWVRMSRIEIGADGWTRRHHVTAGELVSIMEGNASGTWPVLPECMPLGEAVMAHGIARALEPGESERALEGADAALAACRAALARYVEDEMRICGDGVFLKAGLPCLTGWSVPSIAGVRAAWRCGDSHLATRHDRIDDHVRFVGRVQSNDERARFGHFVEVIEAAVEGLVPDDGHVALCANRLPGIVDRACADRMRAWTRRLGSERAGALAAIRDSLLDDLCLGLVGAIPPAAVPGVIMRCRDAARAIAEADPRIASVMAILVAYAEEVALPVPGVAHAMVEADAEGLAGLAY